MKKKTLVWLIALLFLCPAIGIAETLTLSFVGDVSIGDAAQYVKHASSFHGTVAANGLDWPFSEVAHVLLKDDVTVANLEGSITTRKSHKDIRYPLVIDPANIQVLVQGGIDVVNTANNHAYDFFADGYQDTLSALDAAGIGHFGTLSPPSSTKVDRQTVVTRKGIQIGFLGYTYPQNKDLALIEKAVAALRAEGCSLIVLSLHWGRETHMQPNSAQIKFAEKAIQLGVDVVYGHHPHVLQPIAMYGNAPVMFSTGNFVFGTMSKVDPSTGVFQLVYEIADGAPVLSEVRVIPYRTSGSGDYRAMRVTDTAEQQKIFRFLRMEKVPAGYTALPEAFLTTGVAQLNQ